MAAGLWRLLGGISKLIENCYFFEASGSNAVICPVIGGIGKRARPGCTEQTENPGVRLPGNSVVTASEVYGAGLPAAGGNLKKRAKGPAGRIHRQAPFGCRSPFGQGVPALCPKWPRNADTAASRPGACAALCNVNKQQALRRNRFPARLVVFYAILSILL